MIAENMLQVVVLNIHYSPEVLVLEVHHNSAAVAADHIQHQMEVLLGPVHLEDQMFQVVEFDYNWDFHLLDSSDSEEDMT